MRATARICKISVNTVASLLREIGPIADQYHHENVRGVDAARVQLDEVWTYIRAKPKRAATMDRKDAGEIWTWTAIDPDTKLLISFLCGPRTAKSGLAFMKDVRLRLAGTPHFASDGLVSYKDAIFKVYGNSAVYTQIVFNKKTVICGTPELREAGTSIIERWNLTLRQQNARFHRKTLAFSKSLEQHVNQMALWIVYYNWVRVHKTLKTTPAVAAGLAKHRWSMHWIAELAELYHETAADVAARAAAQRDRRQSIH